MDRPKHRPVWDLSAGFLLTWQAPRPLIPFRPGIQDYGTADVGVTWSPHPLSEAAKQHWIGLSWCHTPDHSLPPVPDGRGAWLDRAPISCFMSEHQTKAKYKTTLSARCTNSLLAHWILHEQGRSWFPMVFKPRTLLAWFMRSQTHTQLWLSL